MSGMRGMRRVPRSFRSIIAERFQASRSPLGRQGQTSFRRS